MRMRNCVYYRGGKTIIFMPLNEGLN